MKNKYLRMLSAFLALVVLLYGFPIPLHVDAVSVDNLTYSISNGEVIITDCNESVRGELVIPATIENCPVTGIGEYAFSFCDGLTSITLPNGVVSIGKRAFEGCKSLTDITLPDSVTSIGRFAFSGCSGLTSITIPDGVTIIGWHTFSGCSSLTSVEIPGSVTRIGDGAFYNCSGLTRITIPDSVTIIDWSAFSGCSSLTSVEIPDGVTEIKNYLFDGCTSLKEITIPRDIQSIEPSAFEGCTALERINFRGTQNEWNTLEQIHYSIPIDVTIVCLVTYMVTYDANGGSDAPPAQKSDYMEIRICDQVPVRNGYTFLGWSDAKDGDVVCQPGDVYSYEDNCTLYALWAKNITVTYDANGGVAAPETSIQLENKSFQLSLQTPSLSGAIFKGWSTTKDGIVEYAPGDSCTVDEDITLYAVWHRSCSVCDGDGYDGFYSGKCAICGGTGGEKCTKCGGDGTSGKQTCPYCNGTGSRVVTCYSCSGNGYRTTTCTTCNGSGSVSGTGTVRCGFCSGTGRYWSSILNCYATCQNCGGTGWLSTTVQQSCFSCSGLGYKTTSCTLCSGNGWGTQKCNSTISIKCTSCGGDGRTNCTLCDGEGYTNIGKTCAACEGAGSVPYTHTIGDLNLDGSVNEDDAIYLLQHVLLPDIFTVSQFVDYYTDGVINEDDAIYLLQHVLLPDIFPLS